MGYYQGDYYAGARGDPFWGALLGVAKRVGGALLGGARGGGGPKMLPAAAGGIPAAMGGAVSAGRAIIKRGVGAIIKHPVLSAAGAAGVGGMVLGAGGEMLARPGMHPGFHVSRKTGKMVRNRHMNPCNPRALRRAIRRATRFTHLAMKTIHLVHPKKKGRFGGFRKRKRAA